VNLNELINLNKQGGYLAIQAVGNDITERRRVMKELQDAKELAEAAAEAKSLFLANMR